MGAGVGLSVSGVGFFVGNKVGSFVGAGVGVVVGLAVGAPVPHSPTHKSSSVIPFTKGQFRLKHKALSWKG